MINAKNILIVDDEPRTRQGLKKTLDVWSKGQYDIFCASNATDALEILEQQRIHLLITDIHMPEINGLKFIQTFQSKADKPVVIIISGYAEFDYAQEALRLSVLNYLLKPLDKRKLIAAVEKALKVEENRQRTNLIEKTLDHKLMDAKENIQDRSPIIEAVRFVEENLNRRLGLKEVANAVHLNPSYFSVLFKEQTELTFSEYVTRSRIQYAKNLLISTRMPITDIAEQVGYQTDKYFIKIFKEHESLTPSRYRRQLSEQGGTI